jgi:hypothetical protein
MTGDVLLAERRWFKQGVKGGALLAASEAAPAPHGGDGAIVCVEGGAIQARGETSRHGDPRGGKPMRAGFRGQLNPNRPGLLLVSAEEQIHRHLAVGPTQADRQDQTRVDRGDGKASPHQSRP